MKRKRKSERRNVWNAEVIDPLIKEYLSSYHHERIEREESETNTIQHNFTLKEGVDPHRLDLITTEIYAAVKKLAEATLRAYRTVDPNDIELFIDDLVPDCISTMRLYYDETKGSCFTYLIYLIKTRYSHYYKGFFPCSSIYDKRNIVNTTIESKSFTTEEEAKEIEKEFKEKIKKLGKDYFVYRNTKTVSLRQKKTSSLSEIDGDVDIDIEERKELSIWDELDFDELLFYFPDVVGGNYHKRLAEEIINIAQDVLRGGTIHQGRRSIQVALKARIQEEIGAMITLSDLNLAIFIIRKATELYLEDNKILLNPAETLMINKIQHYEPL